MRSERTVFCDHCKNVRDVSGVKAPVYYVEKLMDREFYILSFICDLCESHTVSSIREPLGD
jgi:hypothetical protein